MKQPTVIAHSAGPVIDAAQPLPSSAPTPYVIRAGKPVNPVTIHSSEPSVIPGTIRRGLDIDTAQLAKHFPAALPGVLSLAVYTLQHSIISTLSISRCAQWGMQAQKSYTTAVDASLAITTSNILQSSLRNIARLQAILRPLADSLLRPVAKSMLFWKPAPSPQAMLQQAQPELAQLRRHLAQALPELRAMQARLELISSELLQLCTTLDAESIAAHYIADVLGQADARAPSLMQQSAALVQMVSHIQQGLVLRSSSTQTMQVLAHRIQDTVLVALPAWMEKISLLSHAQQINATERYTLGQQLDTLLAQLH
jgi:hypothetical protein